MNVYTNIEIGIIHQISKYCPPFLSFKIGEQIDARDQLGRWYGAQIIDYKPRNKRIPKEAKLHYSQQQRIKQLQKYEAICIHYEIVDDKYSIMEMNGYLLNQIKLYVLVNILKVYAKQREQNID